MVKKINKDSVAIKTLLNKGLKPIEVAKILGVSKQKVNYWRKNEIKSTQTRRKKLDMSFIQEICELAGNKTTSEMSSRKIASIINEKLKAKEIIDKNRKPVKISHVTACSYLNQILGRPRKIRKVFYLTKEQMKKLVNFCNSILAKNLSGKQIMFTDETKIDLSPFTRDSIRLTKESTSKLKEGDVGIYELISRQERKFEPSIIIAGGISSYGLSHLLLLDGTLNEFAYGQALLYFKEDIEQLEKKYNENIIFEQDGARAHTSKTNLNLLNKIFGDNKWIQNPPNSADLAYPIEDLWAIIKPRIKRKNPKTIDELKQYITEEWNSIPKTLIENLCKNYINRIKKVIELDGARLEPEHLKKLGGGVKKEIYNWKKTRDQKLKVVYNDEQLLKYKKKEIAFYKNQIKKLKSRYAKKYREAKKIKKRDLYGKSLGYAKQMLELPENIKLEKKNKIDELKNEVNLLSQMDMINYLNHMKEKKMEQEKKENDVDDESTIDESINKILELKGLISKEEKIEYKFIF